MKAFIASHNPGLTEDDLRKKYNHHVTKLVDACKAIDPAFAFFENSISRLAFGPDVRYHYQAVSGRDVVEVVDLAHDLCHFVARRILNPPHRTA